MLIEEISMRTLGRVVLSLGCEMRVADYCTVMLIVVLALMEPLVPVTVMV